MAGSKPDSTPWRFVRSIDPISADEITERVDLVERKSADWLDEHVDKFDPFKWDDVEDQELHRKGFAEAGLALLQAEGMGADVYTPALQDQVIELTNDPRYRQLLERHPMMVRLFAYPILYVDRIGELEDQATSEALSEAIRSESAWARERTAFEMIDMWMIATIHGVDCPYGLEELLSYSCLEYPPNVFWSDDSDLNPLTHNIFIYGLYGMEFDDLDTPDLPAPYDVELELKLAVLRSLAEANYDMGYEYVMSGIMQRQLPEDLVRIWLSDAITAVEQHEFLPRMLGDVQDDGPYAEAGEGSIPDGLKGFSEDRLKWFVHNHTQSVAQLATRIVKSEWADFRAETDSAGLEEGRYEAADVYKLGEVVSSLSAYDLKRAARQLRALSDSPVTEAYPEVFDAVVTCLREQRRSDGEFGFWPDERTQFLSLGYDNQAFDDQLLGPTTEACTRALDEVDGAQ